MDQPMIPALTGDALAEWDRLMADGGLLGMDASVVAAHCLTFGRWTEAERVLADKGVLYKAPSGTVTISPMVAVSERAAKQIREFHRERAKAKKRARPVIAGKTK